jgi:TonB family protein
MEPPTSNDEFLHRLRVRPQQRFATRLRSKLDLSAIESENSMSAYILSSAALSRRSVVLLAIVGAHVAMVLVFANGLFQKVTSKEAFRIEAKVLDREPLPEETPTASEPVLEKFVVRLPQPQTPIEYLPDVPAISATDETLGPAYSGTASQDTGSEYVGAGIGKNFPNPDAFYPSTAIRQEIEGRAIVRVCIGPDGKLAEAPQIKRSTRNRLLDDAALRLARAGSYVAGSHGGMAITDCFNFQTTFQLKNGY